MSIPTVLLDPSSVGKMQHLRNPFHLCC